MTRTLEHGPRRRSTAAKAARVLLLNLWSLTALTGCGRVEQQPPAVSAEETVNSVHLVVLRADGSHTPGPDEAPQVELARVDKTGEMSRLPGKYLAAEPFRDGAAAVTMARELLFVGKEGTSSTLAHAIEGLPSRTDGGDLLYAAKYGEMVEIHRLSVSGRNDRLASFAGTATRLVELSEKRVAFIGAAAGGVAGLWFTDTRGARCLTNCSLRAGDSWGAAYEPPPRDLSSLELRGSALHWTSPDGSKRSVQLSSGEHQ